MVRQEGKTGPAQSDLSARDQQMQERADLTAVQPENPGRRDLLRRTVAIGTATAIGLVVPNIVFGARRPVEEPTTTPFDAQQAARKRLAEMRTSERRLVPATAEPSEIRGRRSFGPGSKVDRGDPTDKVFYVRADDFWWKDAGSQYLDVVERTKVPVMLGPVEEAVRAYPDLIRRADSLRNGRGRRLVDWINHTKGHEPLDEKSTKDIMRALLPQTHALEDVLLREENSLFITPPYGAGALPGRKTDPQIKTAAKRLDAGILGWTIDTKSWAGASEDQIVNIVLSNIVRGGIIITHPVADGTEARAMRRWVKTLRNRGWRAGRLSELSHRKATGH